MEIKILESKEYEKFQLYEYNREVVPGRIEWLMDSIRKLDVTPERPILVTKTKKIIDGQHRYLACQKLKKPVFYIVSQTINDDNIDVAMTLLNNYQSNWKTQDYVTHFSKRGFQDYIAIKDCVDRFGISYDSAVTIVGNKTGRATNEVRTGKFKKGDIAYEDIANVLLSFKDAGFGEWKGTHFIRAIITIMARGKYDHKRDFQKFSKNRWGIRECATTDQYLKYFNSLLMKYSHNKVIVEELA